MVEVKRLESHPHQQHAMALLNAVSATRVARSQDRAYWVCFARWRLTEATRLRLIALWGNR